MRTPQIRCDLSYRTPILYTACNKALFRVVCDICCKNRMDVSHLTISASGVYAVQGCSLERVKDDSHAVVKCLISCKGLYSLTEAVERADGNIA